MKFSEIKENQIYLRHKDFSGRENVLSKIREFIKLQQKKHVGCFSQFLKVNYFFHKKTVIKTFRNPVKYNWISSKKTNDKKNLGFTLQGIALWNYKNMRNCYFWGYFGCLGTNVEFNGFLWLCEFLKVSAFITVST